jgi:16S rRNA (uracil1498-N3)-methyltransferase
MTDAPRIRLYVAAALAAGAPVALEAGQAHYLGNVMRLKPGDAVALFNGRDGEWRARIETLRRGAGTLVAEDRARAQDAPADLWLAFAPIKRARIDILAAAATELGVAALWPVLTRHAAVERVNAARLLANAVEAAEQCERLTVPAVFEPARLDEALARWPAERRILLCDETRTAPPIADVLAAAARPPEPWAVLVGPEGGFARGELDALGKVPFVTPVSLGPRILRADTAAVAALACWQALLGDWRGMTA